MLVSRDMIVAVIVTYRPDVSLVERIKPVFKQVSKIVIVDNTEDESVLPLVDLLTSQGCYFIRNEKNLGIAQALNIGIDWAISEGFSWILTLDDDSRIFDNLVSLYIQALNGPLRGFNVGVLNSKYIDRHTGTVGAVIAGKEVSEGWIDVSVMISSGCFFSVNVYRNTGGFRKEFFLDWFDHDFCLRVRRKGYRNYIFNKPMLEHALGKKSKHTLLWFIPVITNNHLPQRCYLITRNLVVILKENFYQEFFLSLFYVAYIIQKFVFVLCFEEDKSKKLSALWKGLLDGLLKPFNIPDFNQGHGGMR
jgi:rhamnosyltransferase